MRGLATEIHDESRGNRGDYFMSLARDTEERHKNIIYMRDEGRYEKEQAGYECEAWPRRYMMRVEVTEETTSCHWREIRRKYDRLSNGTRCRLEMTLKGS